MRDHQVQPNGKTLAMDADLRLKATTELERQPLPHPHGFDGWPEEAQRAYREFHVYRVELEMQNEELKRTQLDLVKARDDYRSLYDYAPCMLVETDLNGLILEVNLTTLSMLGYVRSEILRRPLSEFVVPDQRKRFYLKARALLRSVSPRVVEFTFLTREGSTIDLQLQCQNLFETGGTRSRIAAIDISEQKRAVFRQREIEAQFIQAQKLESLGVMAGGIAHDFNNLLTSILGNGELIHEDPDLPQTSHEALESILESTRAAAALTQQMLAYAGRGPICQSAFDFREVIESVRDFTRVSIPKEIETLYELPPHPCPVSGDLTQLKQVVMNLLINASEAIGETYGTIRVRLQELSLRRIRKLLPEGAADPLFQGLGYLLEVADTGCGIPPEKLPNIFEPFFTTKFTGRGLGLSAVQGIIRGHDGCISVSSTQMIGTTFFVALPKTNLPLPVKAAPPAENSGEVSSLQILVIDDESFVRQLLARLLVSQNHKSFTAEDGLRGIALWQEHREEIDLIILDLTMPHLNGYDTLAQLRESGCSAPVIITSGYNENHLPKKLDREQASGFLKKPFNPREVEQVIFNAMKNCTG